MIGDGSVMAGNTALTLYRMVFQFSDEVILRIDTYRQQSSDNNVKFHVFCLSIFQ